MQHDEHHPVEYISYNALGRSPMVWGVPFMPFLLIGSMSMLCGVVAGILVGTTGLLFGFLGVPVLIFIKMICANDDGAVRILLIEVKWFLIKLFGGNAKFFDGTLSFAPVSYGRKLKHVKRYFETSVSR